MKPYVCSFLLLALSLVAASSPAPAATAREKSVAASKRQATPAKPLGVFTDRNGNTGVGTAQPVATLDVLGELRVGATDAACTAKTAGALRYAGGALQLCDGAGWKLIRTTAAPP